MTSMLGFANHVLGDHQLLNLGRTFVDSEQANISVEALNGVFAYVTCAAMDLHAAICDPSAHFSGKHLGARGFSADVMSIVPQASGVQDHAAGGVDFCLAVSEHRLDQLKFGNGFTELLTFQRVAQGIVEHALGGANAQRSDMQAAFVQNFHGGLETDAFDAADELAGRYPCIFEDHVAGVGTLMAHLVVWLAKRYAGGSAFYDKSTDTACTYDLGIRARHHCIDPGVWSIGNEALGAVKDIVVAIANRGGFQRRGIGTGVRLGQAKSAEQFACGEFGQIIILLLRRAVQQDANGADPVVGSDVDTLLAVNLFAGVSR